MIRTGKREFESRGCPVNEVLLRQLEAHESAPSFNPQVSRILLIVDGVRCDETCERGLYATRQARTIQGREQDRVLRVLLQPTGAPPLSAELLAAHPGMIVVQGDSRQWQTLPGAAGLAANIYLLDPRGNLVLRYPADPDIRGLAKDMERLLRASRIG